MGDGGGVGQLLKYFQNFWGCIRVRGIHSKTSYLPMYVCFYSNSQKEKLYVENQKKRSLSIVTTIYALSVYWFVSVPLYY